MSFPVSAPAPTAANEREHATHWRQLVERTLVSHMKGIGWLPQFDPEMQLANALSRVSPDLQRELAPRIELYAKRCIRAHTDSPRSEQMVEQKMNGTLWNDLSVLAIELRAQARTA